MQRKIQEFKRPLEHTALNSLEHTLTFRCESPFGFLYRIWLPWWLRQWRIRLQSGRLGFSPWVGKFPWRRKWQLTPAFLPGESHGQRSLAGYSPGGQKKSDMTQRLNNNNSNLTCYDAILNDIILKIYFLTVFLNCLFEKDNWLLHRRPLSHLGNFFLSLPKVSFSF